MPALAWCSVILRLAVTALGSLLCIVLPSFCVCSGVSAQMVKNTDLVVGDVYLVNMGDKVVADGVMIDGFHLVIDEASLTGDEQQVI